MRSLVGVKLAQRLTSCGEAVRGFLSPPPTPRTAHFVLFLLTESSYFFHRYYEYKAERKTGTENFFLSVFLLVSFLFLSQISRLGEVVHGRRLVDDQQRFVQGYHVSALAAPFSSHLFVGSPCHRNTPSSRESQRKTDIHTNIRSRWRS